jgi:hypothetical protein
MCSSSSPCTLPTNDGSNHRTETRHGHLQVGGWLAPQVHVVQSADRRSKRTRAVPNWPAHQGKLAGRGFDVDDHIVCVECVEQPPRLEFVAQPWPSRSCPRSHPHVDEERHVRPVRLRTVPVLWAHKRSSVAPHVGPYDEERRTLAKLDGLMSAAHLNDTVFTVRSICPKSRRPTRRRCARYSDSRSASSTTTPDVSIQTQHPRAIQSHTRN